MSNKGTNGSSQGSLAAFISDSEGDLRLSDGEKSKRMAKKASRLCISVRDRERVKVGEEIEIVPYRHGAMIRLIFIAPRNIKIERTGKRGKAGSKNLGKTEV